MLAAFGVVQGQPFDGHYSLVTSNVFKNPYVLAVLRLLIGCYTAFVLLFSIIWDEVKYHTGKAYFSYFTHLTYIGICAYAFAAGVQTLLYARTGRQSYPLQRWHRLLQTGHVILLSSVVTLPIIVTLVYWALLAGPSSFAEPVQGWTTVSVHAFNAVVALFEILFTNIPVLPWIALVPNILILALYVCVAYITFETQGFYVYPFLNPASQGAKLAIYVVGIPLAECVVFCIVQGALVLRQRLTGRQGYRLGDSVGMADGEKHGLPSPTSSDEKSASSVA